MFVRDKKRTTEEYHFPSEDMRDSAYSHIGLRFPDVALVKKNSTSLLFTRTGSINYDMLVFKELKKYGAFSEAE